MIGLLRRAWGVEELGHVECRRCGTTLDGIPEQCPECDADAVIRYPPSILE